MPRVIHSGANGIEVLLIRWVRPPRAHIACQQSARILYSMEAVDKLREKNATGVGVIDTWQQVVLNCIGS